jgi:predicted ABC-type ATPase
MWIIAGPNGAGKSTYLESAAPHVFEIVRPDEFAIRLVPDAPESAALRAGKLAVERMHTLIDMGHSFAVETTFSGQLHLTLARRAQASGWRIRAIYVGLRNSRLAIKRVQQRTLEGGHNVPAGDIARRYDRGLENLRTILEFADEVEIFDNSSSRQKMKLVLIVQRGKTIWRAQRMPAWLAPILPH